MASGTEGRLYELLLTYVEATESGHAPDRESFLRENSQFASEIAEFFAGEDRVEYFAAPLRSATQAVLRTIPVGPQTPGAGTAILDSPFVAGQAFGDYELISEIGRGGMGVVYKARQRSLNRLVAIKIFEQRASPRPRRFNVSATKRKRLLLWTTPASCRFMRLANCKASCFSR
jgi:hypothetical protein